MPNIKSVVFIFFTQFGRRAELEGDIDHPQGEGHGSPESNQSLALQAIDLRARPWAR